MVEKTKELTKRAKWVKIKKELLKLPGKIPEIIAIGINIKDEAIVIVTEPVSPDYELNLYGIGRKLRYEYKFPFEGFSIKNLSNYNKDFPWKENILYGLRIIYERHRDGN